MAIFNSVKRPILKLASMWTFLVVSVLVPFLPFSEAAAETSEGTSGANTAAAKLTDGGIISHVEVGAHNVPKRFQFATGDVAWQRTATRRFETWESFKVTFPSPVVTDVAQNNTVHCEYFTPAQTSPVEQRPAVVVLHILGGDFELSRVVCRALAHDGINALFVKMPYYGPRRPPQCSERMISEKPEQTLANLTQAVQDIRRAVDWLQSQPDVDDQRIGITGISLGGIVASLSAGVEPRFSHAALVLAGGDFARLFMESTELADERSAWKQEDVTAKRINDFFAPVDPLTYAERLRGRSVIMFNGKHDTVIPHECTLQLWERAGRPKIVWWNANHYSAAWYLPSGLRQMVKFFGE